MFNRKTILLTLFLSTLVGLVVMSASAQDTEHPSQPQVNFRTLNVVGQLAEAAGMTNAEFVAALRGGSTPAQVIVANGGDVETVVSEIVASMSERASEAVANGRISQEQADELLAGAEDTLRVIMNGDLSVLRGRQNLRDRVGERELLAGALQSLGSAIADLTDVDMREIVSAIRNGEGLRELIVANGSTIEEVIEQATQNAAVRIDEALAAGHLTTEQAEALLSRLDTIFVSAIDGELRNGINNIRYPLASAVAEAAGLQTEAVLEQVAAGQSLSMILQSAGIDVSVFIDEQLNSVQDRLTEAVNAGRMSQAVADARLNLARVLLQERLDRVPVS